MKIAEAGHCPASGPSIVIPAKSGDQGHMLSSLRLALDPRCRGDDGKKCAQAGPEIYLSVSGLAGETVDADADLADGAFPFVVEDGRRTAAPHPPGPRASHWRGSRNRAGRHPSRHSPAPAGSGAGRRRRRCRAGCRGWPSAPHPRRSAWCPRRCSPPNAARSRGRYRPAHRNGTRISRPQRRALDAELGQKIGEGEGADQAVQHQPHGPIGVVGAHEDHRSGKARIAHARIATSSWPVI